ncbi:uncharacterized protein LOC118348924 [Juglans regia]|uniref:Uncharacterized protein LOC118348924 n=1 Tax=Juglans regia TaxID=51240 RepID=A0A6P9EXW6_JUGRE|nr:uncharacterized protein LOC118348924 [Juglans regia]
MRQRRWLELINDYQCNIKYHLGKANVVADALSRKSRSEDLSILSLEEFIPLDWEELKDRQKKDSKLAKVIGKIEKSKGPKDFSIREDGTLYYKNRRVILADQGFKGKVVKEAHNTPYTAHPCSTKMYHDLKQHF